MQPLSSIPEGWRISSLGDIAEIKFSNVDKKTAEGEIPIKLCNYTHVFYNRRILPNMDFMSATATPTECAKWELREGDVLFTKDSESADEIGIASYVPMDLPDVLCGYHLGLARPITGAITGEYLFRSFATHAVTREFSRIANGVTRFGLTLGATRSVPFLIPPLSEQRAIAAILDSIDELIEGIEEFIESAANFRDALAHELLSRGIPGMHSNWDIARGIGTIPTGWRLVRLSESAKLGSGARPIVRGRGVIPVIGANGQTGLTDRPNVRTGIAVGRVGASGTVRPVTSPSWLSDNALHVQPQSSIWNESFLKWALIRADLPKLATRTAQPLLTQSALGGARLPCPPLSEQRSIATALESIESSGKLATAELKQLHQLKRSVSDELLSGRVRAVDVSFA